MLLINYHILGLKKGEALHPAGCVNDNIRLGTLRAAINSCSFDSNLC